MRFTSMIVALLALSACGFKPMYAPTGVGPDRAVIGSVYVPEVEGKSGHAFRTELTRLFDIERDRGGAQKRLEVKVVESVSGYGLRIDESATRADLVLSSTYKLLDARGVEIVAGAVSATAGYDIPASAYGAATAQDDARERAGVLLAQRVRTDIVLRLTRKNKEPQQAEALKVLAPSETSDAQQKPETVRTPGTSDNK